MRILEITIAEVEYAAHFLAKKFMEWNEPIPDFSMRFPGVLESCLATPFTSFGGKKLYKGFTRRASMLFYLMIKNHPFKNGNKRIAMTALFYFLYKNKKWIKEDNKKLYNFAKWVAESDAEVKDATVEAINKFLKIHAVNLSKK